MSTAKDIMPHKIFTTELSRNINLPDIKSYSTTANNTCKHSTGISEAATNLGLEHFLTSSSVGCNCKNIKDMSIQVIPPMSNQKKLKAMISTRIKAEQETQALTNRIAQMQADQIRAWKKIDQTRKRANELASVRVRREDRLKKQIDMLEIRDTQEQEKKNKVQEIKKSREYFTGKSKMLEFERQHKAIMMKIQRHNNESIIKDAEESMALENKKRIGRMQEERRTANARIQNFRQQKLQAVRSDSSQKYFNECNLQTQREKELNQLELLEGEIRTQLRLTERLKRKALVQFTDLKNNPNTNTDELILKLKTRKKLPMQKSGSSYAESTSMNNTLDGLSDVSRTISEPMPDESYISLGGSDDGAQSIESPLYFNQPYVKKSENYPISHPVKVMRLNINEKSGDTLTEMRKRNLELIKEKNSTRFPMGLKPYILPIMRKSPAVDLEYRKTRNKSILLNSADVNNRHKTNRSFAL